MAIPIKVIQILDGQNAEDFILQADKNEEYLENISEKEYMDKLNRLKDRTKIIHDLFIRSKQIENQWIEAH